MQEWFHAVVQIGLPTVTLATLHMAAYAQVKSTRPKACYMNWLSFEYGFRNSYGERKTLGKATDLILTSQWPLDEMALGQPWTAEAHLGTPTFYSYNSFWQSGRMSEQVSIFFSLYLVDLGDTYEPEGIMTSS